jgi:thymidylate synthase (FAD)
MNINLLSITGDSEKIIEYCSRICYNSFNRIEDSSYKTQIENLIKNGHHSLLEHACATFLIDDISRSCSHQLVRHRHASFTQESQRYVKEQTLSYIVPPSIKNNPEALEIFEESMVRSHESYNLLLDLGIKKEDARYVRPNASHTTIAMTANFREWLHIIDLRVSLHAQWEIRDLITLIWKELYGKAPAVFGFCYFQYWSKDVDYKKEIFDNKIKM